MGDFSVLITPPVVDGRLSETLRFTTPDLAASLVVAELNLDGGTAELHRDGKLLARMRSLGKGGQPVWIVNPT